MRSSVVVRSAAALLVLAVGGQVALASGTGLAHIQAQATMAATMTAASMAATKAPTMAGTLASIPETCDKTAGLTLYSAQGYDTDIAKIFTDKTGIAVNLVDDSTGPLIAKISAEGTNPQWDVAFFDGDAAMQALDDQGLLAHWDSPSIANYTELGLKLLPKSHAYYPAGVTAAAAIVYNTDKVKKMNLELPKDWNDLLDSKYKDLIAESNPSISGPSYQHIASIATIMGGIDKAKDYFLKLKANGMKIFDTAGPATTQITTGNRVFAIVQDAGAFAKAASGQPLAVIYPTSGVGVLPGVLAISAKAQHLGCAAQFVNYLLTADGQNAIANGDPAEGDRYYISVIKDTKFPLKRTIDGINWVYLDIATYAKAAADYKAWFRDNISQ